MDEMTREIIRVELMGVLDEFNGSILTVDTTKKIKDVLSSWIATRFPGTIDPSTIHVSAGPSALFVEIPDLWSDGPSDED